nr:uncharacterized protein LOC113724469 [Coffea arabica]
MAESNALENIYVDLRGVEDDVASIHHGVAGNLSPRLVVLPQKLLESSRPSLNIDQSQMADREFRQMQGKGVRARFPSNRQLRSETSSKNSFHRRARISKRLDRFLVNGACLDLSDAISVLHLTRHPSDHAPLKISFVTRLDNKPRPFCFLNVWTSKPELIEVIRQAWNQDVDGPPLQVLCSKLLATRRAIQSWNKQHFGNVIDSVHSAKMAVQWAEEMVDQDDSEECQIELNKAQAKLCHALLIEEQFWRQKARVKWLQEGDRNSRYFHAVVRQRRVQGMIHHIKNSNGVWVDTDDDIALEATTYFHDLFTGPLDSYSNMSHLIPHMVSQEENTKLESVPTIEEVYRVIKSMDGDSAAGLDGFTGKIFTFAWEVIAQDVYNEVVSGMGKKIRGGNVVMKLDMSKAYDRVAWGHIINVLRRFGFGEIFIDMGDPLSPALFIIGAEVLSRGLNNLVVQLGFIGNHAGVRGLSKVFGAANKCAKKLLLSPSNGVFGEKKGD